MEGRTMNYAAIPPTCRRANKQRKNSKHAITNFQENQNSFYLNKHHPFYAVKRTYYQIQEVLWF